MIKKVERPTRICPACHSSGFIRSIAEDGRPKFDCQLCEYTWTSGLDGSPYAGGEQPSRLIYAGTKYIRPDEYTVADVIWDDGYVIVPAVSTNINRNQ